MKDYLFFCCYGRAGYEALNIILLKNYFGYKKLIIFTHKKDNDTLISFIKNLKLEYYTESINKCKYIINNKNGFLLSFHYRNIIKEDILNCFNGRAVNLHPSLLPNYKGCFSSVWAIINGEKETGISYHECIPEIDNGNILIQEKININDNETGYSLFNKLISLAILHLEKLFKLIDEDYKGITQNGKGTYYKREIPFNNIIDSNWSEEYKKRYIRALYYPPYDPPIEAPKHNS